MTGRQMTATRDSDAGTRREAWFLLERGCAGRAASSVDFSRQLVVGSIHRPSRGPVGGGVRSTLPKFRKRGRKRGEGNNV